MSNSKWPSVWKVGLGKDFEIELPLMDLGNDFYIYSHFCTYEFVPMLCYTKPMYEPK